jgi:hypothetical protein
MRVDGLDKTVIGVMPKNFYMFDDQADFWTPMNLSLANSCFLDRIAVFGNSGHTTHRDGDGM